MAAPTWCAGSVVMLLTGLPRPRFRLGIAMTGTAAVITRPRSYRGDPVKLILRPYGHAIGKLREENSQP